MVRRQDRRKQGLYGRRIQDNTQRDKEALQREEAHSGLQRGRGSRQQDSEMGHGHRRHNRFGRRQRPYQRDDKRGQEEEDQDSDFPPCV